MSISLQPRGLVWAPLLLAAVLLAGCRSGDDADATESGASAQDAQAEGAAPGLSPAQTKDAVLPRAQLGPGWKRDRDMDAETFDIACGELIESALQGARNTASASVGYSLDIGLPRFVSTVTTYETADGLPSVFETMAAELDACPPVASADYGGYVYKLKFRKAPAVPGIQADQQFAYTATGTLASPEGEEFLLRHHVTHARVGSSIASILIHSGYIQPARFHRAAVKVAVDRLVAIVEGKTPPKAKVHSPAL